MKVRCRLPWDVEKDLGRKKPEGMDMEEFTKKVSQEMAQNTPHLRPCGKFHGVAVKATCRRCADCVEIFED